MAKEMSCCSKDGKCGMLMGIILVVIALVWIAPSFGFKIWPYDMWAFVFLVFGLKFLYKSFK